MDKPKYQEKYNYLKEKYGKNLVADWPEVTDPQKFVYEDIAIAAYLLVLWDGLGFKAFQGFICALNNHIPMCYLSHRRATFSAFLRELNAYFPAYFLF